MPCWVQWLVNRTMSVCRQVELGSLLASWQNQKKKNVCRQTEQGSRLANTKKICNACLQAGLGSLLTNIKQLSCQLECIVP